MRALGWLSDLRRDERGNTLAIMAAALVPIAGMMGSGLDMSRAYMAKAKLQTACDSAALAARRHMSSGFITEAAKAEGRKFFNFNFPAGTMKTEPVTLKIDAKQANLSEVEVTASTRVPTSVMKIFGRNSIAISAACNADQDYVNNDIMLVLDVTGSMNCAAGTGAACTYKSTKQTNSRLELLEDAAGSLYDALAGAQGVRIRYGFMPYSMTVNVKSTLTGTWLRSKSKYHKCTTTNANGCKTWGTDSGLVSRTSEATGCIEERSDIGGAEWPIRISSAVTMADIDTVPATEAQRWPEYDPGNTTGEGNATYGTQYSNLISFCPSPAVKLNTYATRTAFDAQVTAALSKVGGYTNHELGIIWGMRYLSTTGLFASENPATWAVNSKQVRVDKHIVFLTDGDMTADNNNYSSYGIPIRDNRLSGSASLEDKHKNRFTNACTRARTTGGATIWVIALDTAGGNDTAIIKGCASGEDHFFTTDGTNLKEIFTVIGKGIGKLRITK
jgi:Flp pilus assembly protein TadG